MNYYNADGSTAEMCGNGVRCTADFARKFWNISTPTILVETRSGIKPVEVTDDGYRVNMGAAAFSHPEDFPEQSETIEEVEWNFASMGNPHAVGFFESPEEISEILPTLGKKIEGATQYFPNKINVNFVAPKNLAENHFQVSTYERGAGPTLACGTGASASFSWIQKKFPASQGKKVRVDVPGGTLYFATNESQEIFMTGPSAVVSSGEISLRKKI